MKRKLVKQGTSTMMISLPTKWIKENKLDKGDEVNVEEKGINLVIGASEKKNTKKEIVIALTDQNYKDLRVFLTHSYRRGFDKIILTGYLEEASKEINSLVSDVLLGFEVVERAKDKIAIENISSPDETKYEIILSKVFIIVKDMPNIILNKPNISELKETKDHCDKFVLFCRKIISENKFTENPMLEWEFLTLLTHVQHTYYYLGEYIHTNKVTISKDLESLILESGNYFNLLYEAHHNKDITQINKINSLKNKFQYGKCLELIAKSKGKEAVAASYLREIFRWIQISSSPLLSKLLEK